MEIKEKLVLDGGDDYFYQTDKKNVLYCKEQRGWAILHSLQENLIDQSWLGYFGSPEIKEKIKFVFVDIYRERINGRLCGSVQRYRVSKRSIIKL